MKCDQGVDPKSFKKAQKVNWVKNVINLYCFKNIFY